MVGMRLLRGVLPLAFVLVLAAPVAAQNQACNAFPTQSDQNVCNAAIDGTQLFHPVAGLLMSGGNSVLGSFKPLGGFPHFSITARVNATKLRTPDLNYDGTSGTTVGVGDEITAPVPVIEAAVGLFGGAGEMKLFSIEALGSAQLLPTTQIDNLTVDKNARKIGSVALGLGFGGRVGITSGKAIIPAVAVSVMKRSIPRLTYGDLTGSDRYSFGIDWDITNVRATAGYKFSILQVGAGLGWDKYTGTAKIQFKDNLNATQTLSAIDLDQSRTLAFLGATLDFPVFKIAAEAGYQFGKDQQLSTTFTDNDPKDNRLFASAGIRLSF
jgi:hypothetical protein